VLSRIKALIECCLGHLHLFDNMLSDDERKIIPENLVQFLTSAMGIGQETASYRVVCCCAAMLDSSQRNLNAVQESLCLNLHPVTSLITIRNINMEKISGIYVFDSRAGGKHNIKANL